MNESPPTANFSRTKLIRIAAGFITISCVVWAFATLQQDARAKWLGAASVADLERAAGDNPGDPDLLFRVAGRLYKQGETKKAFGLMQQVVKQKPNDARAWFGYGNAARDSDQIREAALGFRHASEIDPLNAQAWAALAEIYADAGLVTDALEAFDRAYRAKPTAYIDYTQWARCLADAGRFADAIEKARTAIALQPQPEDPYTTVSRAAIALKQQGSVEPLLRRRIYMTRGYPVAVTRTALVRLLLSKPHTPALLAEAEELAAASLADSAAGAEQYGLLARIRLLRGNVNSARQAIQQGLAHKPDEPELVTILLEIETLAKNENEASRIRMKLADSTRRDAALEGLRKSADDVQRSEEARLKLANALIDAGKPGEAAEQCLHSIKSGAASPEAQSLVVRARDAALLKLEIAKQERTARVWKSLGMEGRQ